MPPQGRFGPILTGAAIGMAVHYAKAAPNAKGQRHIGKKSANMGKTMHRHLPIRIILALAQTTGWDVVSLLPVIT